MITLFYKAYILPTLSSLAAFALPEHAGPSRSDRLATWILYLSSPTTPLHPSTHHRASPSPQYLPFPFPNTTTNNTTSTPTTSSTSPSFPDIPTASQSGE